MGKIRRDFLNLVRRGRGLEKIEEILVLILFMFCDIIICAVWVLES